MTVRCAPHRFLPWPWLALGLLLWLAPRVALANPVNAEKLMSGVDHDGWRGNLESRLALSRGNVERLDFSTSGSLQFLTLYPATAGHRRAPAEGTPRFFRDRWVLLTSGAFVRVGENDVVNRGFGHTRYTRMWRPRIGSDVFAQVQFDAFTRLRVRMVGGLGVRVDPIRREHVQAWLGSGYMVEYEVNDIIQPQPGEPADPHPAVLVNHRWTNYLVLQLQLADARFVVRNTAYAQPLLTDFTDVRVLDSVQLEARVGENFAVGFSLDTQYDSRPPRTVVPVDLLLGSYLRLGFG
ncbi:MAG: DUF481 domain-containing protein [Nannocystaceae bacterium]